MLQTITNDVRHSAGQFPGWAYQQEVFITGNQNGGGPGCGTGTTCTMNVFPTTAGSAWTIMVNTTNNVTISAVCIGTSSSGCGSSSNQGWTLCPTSSCHAFQSGNIDMAYSTTGSVSSANIYITVTLSGAAGAQFFMLFEEVLPPSGFTAAFDNAAHASSASCSSCTLAALTITGTDAVIHFPVTGASSIGPQPINVFTDPWTQDLNGILTGLNVTSSTTVPSYPQASSAFQDAAIAFKTTSAFTPSANNTLYQLVQMQTNNGFNCSSSTCTFSVNSTGSGHLLFLIADTLNGGVLTSVSGGGTWATPPSGANTCQISLTGFPNRTVSCDYALSSTSGATSLTITTSGALQAYGFAFFEVSRTSGSFALDTQNSANDTSTSCSTNNFNCSGQALTLTGSDDVIFQFGHCDGGCNAITDFPIASNAGGNGPAVSLNSFAVALLNTNNGSAPLIGYPTGGMTVAAVAFK